MFPPRAPGSIARLRPLNWLLVLMAVVILALAASARSPQCACDAGTADVLGVCEQIDQEGLPVHPEGKATSTAEPKPTYVLPPTEGLIHPDLNVEHPPPRRG